jgi:hypothetical protein
MKIRLYVDNQAVRSKSLSNQKKSAGIACKKKAAHDERLS